MPGIWFALRKSLPCKSQPSGAQDTSSRSSVDHVQARNIKRSSSLGCLANLKGVIHGSKRHNRKPSICSPNGEFGGAEKPNPADGDELVLDDLKPTTDTPCPPIKVGLQSDIFYYSISGCELRRSLSENSRRCGDSILLALPVCQTCTQQHKRSASIGAKHSLSKNGVSELVEGNSSRKIVEIICQTTQENYNNDADNEGTKIEKILKVHNFQSVLDCFEEYREMVKTKARKQFDDCVDSPRCVADGNELLMFYATTFSCSLSTNSSSSVCELSHCGACRIMRNGFFTREDFVCSLGIFAASNSDKALRYARGQEGGDYKSNKAVFVCRVIAGKIHRPIKKIKHITTVGLGFDSLAWNVGQENLAEDLILPNPRALLPCFVVIYTV